MVIQSQSISDTLRLSYLVMVYCCVEDYCLAGAASVAHLAQNNSE